MRRSYEELLDIVKQLLDGRTDDEAISILEDFADSRPDETNEAELQAKVEELTKQVKDTDEAWRQRYIERFDNGNSVQLAVEEQQQEEKDLTPPDPNTLFDDVFDEEKGE